MNEKVESLILEHLRAIRGDMATMSERMDLMSAEIVIIRQHMAGVIGSINLTDGEIAKLKVRLDRIERRLELVE